MQELNTNLISAHCSFKNKNSDSKCHTEGATLARNACEASGYLTRSKNVICMIISQSVPRDMATNSVKYTVVYLWLAAPLYVSIKQQWLSYCE